MSLVGALRSQKQQVCLILLELIGENMSKTTTKSNKSKSTKNTYLVVIKDYFLDQIPEVAEFIEAEGATVEIKETNRRGAGCFDVWATFADKHLEKIINVEGVEKLLSKDRKKTIAVGRQRYKLQTKPGMANKVDQQIEAYKNYVYGNVDDLDEDDNYLILEVPPTWVEDISKFEGVVSITRNDD